jgi:hypothetical protein
MWIIISVVIFGNIWLFNALVSNVQTYSSKVLSVQASKYDLEDL